MEENRYHGALLSCRDLPDLFELVKRAVKESLGRERSGLMLAMADLGNPPGGFVGAFYPVDSNIIVMNKVPLKRMEGLDPSLYRAYAFHLLLHEYLHSLGVVDEGGTRARVYQISAETFGKDHPISKMAADISRYVPMLTYPEEDFELPEDYSLELVHGFDRSSTEHYIS